MATVEFVAKYGGLGAGDWESPNNISARRHKSFDYRADELHESSDIGLEGSYAAQRLYRTHRAQIRVTSLKRDKRNAGVADLAFMAFPTVAFSLAVVGLATAALALVENEPAYLMPGALAALGFSFLGWVAYYLARLMRTAVREG